MQGRAPCRIAGLQYGFRRIAPTPAKSMKCVSGTFRAAGAGMRSVFFVVLLLGPSPALAQDAEISERMNRLERELQELRAHVHANDPEPTAPGDPFSSG